MNSRKITLLVLFIIFLTGCNHNESSYSDDPNITHLSTSSNQEAAVQAKELLTDRDDIEAVHAVNTKDTLLVTIEIPHHERFSLKEKTKTYQKELKQTFPNFTIELSTDKKIIIEITELEEKITKNALTEDEIKKQMEKIIHLSKEQT
ncbi:hypothetical protein [Oceanobacillus neutriphilus]|uniref:Sporulation lipoprotein YhcN/YlaJ n=1 Tax=Oceanobacillus neutriphilus TaxID=531815 RepID=A0ABQ2NZW6_9BACI|nr:hypothetical protein [Oceanobacillus neutriphilus]GGP14584.1 hypothetical protein GCM10011346_39120 [Oceanobacillus neutriphilus]